ncbi:MAG: two-component system, NtrC family, sensor histidine kinase HydH [Acidobacteriota bacterium]|jgi:PAS domain S-box-containing protein|nr:two-component system, NtrC family, sensor histidine kinase HydH [Acidobacteriota bacterium]
MLPDKGNKSRLMLMMLAGVILLAGLFALGLVILAPDAAFSRGPLLLAAFIGILVVSFGSVMLLLRRLLRPYRQLVGEAKRAPIAAQSSQRSDEGQFVLETFKSVVAQLQAQQRELEALSAQASARAASAEKFSERIVASVPSGLIAFDSNGRATVVNAPARLLIESEGDAEGKDLRELLRTAPELAEMVENCLKTGEVFRREEAMATGPNGQVRRLGATVAPIDPTPDQEGRGALCLVTDLTEVSQLREQVALKKNLESLGEMSAGLAHEFKNALATLHGYSQLLQGLTLDENGRAASNALLQEVRNLSEMVTAFLNFARPQPLELAATSLSRLVEECRDELNALYHEQSIELRIAGEFPHVAADERMLRQALLNLLRNAAEAIGEGATERFVEVHGSVWNDASGKQWAIIEIRDSGGGIESTDLQRIFIPFFTTKTTGHGVGLALAHRVIAEHGGTLTAANASGDGAVFTIKLPH